MVYITIRYDGQSILLSLWTRHAIVNVNKLRPSFNCFVHLLKMVGNKPVGYKLCQYFKQKNLLGESSKKVFYTHHFLCLFEDIYILINSD